MINYTNLIDVKSLFLYKSFLIFNSIYKPTFYKKRLKFLRKPYSPKYVYHLNHFLYDRIGRKECIFTSNKKNLLNVKRFEVFFYNYILNNQNFLFLDSNYKSVYNIYTSMFSLSTLQNNKNYFFIKPKFFTFKNWIYYFYSFCNSNNIGLLIISDFYKYSRFINELYKKNSIILLFQPTHFLKLESDFYFYINAKNIFFQKMCYLFFINSVFYHALNKKNSQHKINFIFTANVFFKNFIK